MNLKINNVKKKLKNGETCFGTMLRILKSPQSISLCASEGWDYVIFDTEHNDCDYETLGSLSLIAKYEEIEFFVRVPDKLYHQMAQMLDIGAEGLVLPQVKSKEETKHIIESVKYAPIGKRGVSISSIVTRYRDYSQLDYTEWANRELMTIIQIESEEGVNNIDQILTIEGIDAVMIGPSDLTQDMGIPGQINHPRVEEAFREVVAQCNKFKVAPGIHVSNMEDIHKSIKAGMRFITYSYDTKFLKDAYNKSLSKLRNIPKH